MTNSFIRFHIVQAGMNGMFLIFKQMEAILLLALDISTLRNQ